MIKFLFPPIWFIGTAFKAIRTCLPWFFFSLSLTLWLSPAVRGLVFSPVYALGVGNTSTAEVELVPLDSTSGDDTHIQRGDWIAGFRVSAPFLSCSGEGKSSRSTDAPDGCRFWDAPAGRPHLGVDIAAGVGVPLYAWEPATISCHGSAQSKQGYGLWAEIRPRDGGKMFLAGHLSRCTPGNYTPGKAFGAVGNSGYSTGPHLHFEYLNPPQRGGQQSPRFSQLRGVLTGKVTDESSSRSHHLFVAAA